MNCEVNIDDCIVRNGSLPCLNGGVCLDGINSFRCQCPITHTGQRCQKGNPSFISCFKYVAAAVVSAASAVVVVFADVVVVVAANVVTAVIVLYKLNET